MKIVMIGNSGSGGLIGYIKGLLSNKYNSEKYDIVLYCGNALAEKISQIPTDIRIINTQHAADNGLDIILNKPLNPNLVEMIHEENPDIIFFLNGYIRSGLEMYPNIMTLHNQLYIDNRELLRQGFTKTTFYLLMFRHAVRRSMANSDGVIFLSEFSKKQADDHNIKYKDGIVIPFGFEKENIIEKIDDSFNEKKPGDVFKIIYISAIYPYKNHLNLIKACYKLKNEGYKIELSIIGQKKEPYFSRLYKKISSLGMINDVVFHDWVEHEQIKYMIDQSDIFIYPSSTETTGYGLLEGMARGALIAASNQAGFPKMLKDGGVYFNPKNNNSIKEAIEQLIHLDDKIQYEKRKKAYKYSLEYSWEKAGLGHIQYFENILKKLD